MFLKQPDVKLQNFYKSFLANALLYSIMNNKRLDAIQIPQIRHKQLLATIQNKQMFDVSQYFNLNYKLDKILQCIMTQSIRVSKSKIYYVNNA